MTTIKNILVAATLSFGLIGTAHANEQTIKPVQGISFHVGTKHAVAYFLNGDGTCELAVTSADDTNFAPVRREAGIEPGQSLTYQLAEGNRIEFTCQAQALAMIVKSLNAVAAH